MVKRHCKTLSISGSNTTEAELAVRVQTLKPDIELWDVIHRLSFAGWLPSHEPTIKTFGISSELQTGPAARARRYTLALPHKAFVSTSGLNYDHAYYANLVPCLRRNRAKSTPDIRHHPQKAG